MAQNRLAIAVRIASGSPLCSAHSLVLKALAIATPAQVARKAVRPFQRLICVLIHIMNLRACKAGSLPGYLFVFGVAVLASPYLPELPYPMPAPKRKSGFRTFSHACDAFGPNVTAASL